MGPDSMPSRIVLATQSPYKRQLLARIASNFVSDPSGIDEGALPGEHARDQAVRLAEAKAREVVPRHAESWVIGADQLAEFEGAAVGKQPTREQARATLLSFSARELNFHTAVFVLGPGGQRHAHVDLTVARFRPLNRAVVERYIAIDQPFDCTAAFRAEGAGPLLLEALETADPTAIVGLPLIWLSSVLPLNQSAVREGR